MIKVISFFYEDGKIYRNGTLIDHFTIEQEDKRIKTKQAVRVGVKKSAPKKEIVAKATPKKAAPKKK